MAHNYGFFPDLNRSEGDKGAYAETIFHMQRRRTCSTHYK